MRTSAVALSIAALCALLLAACGDSGSSTTATKTVTVPSGKLGSSTLIHEGTYMGSTDETPARRLSFSYSLEDGVTKFTLDGLVIGTMPMGSASFERKVGNVTIKGAWQTATRVTGTIDTVKSSSGGTSLVQRVKWDANAFAS